MVFGNGMTAQIDSVVELHQRNVEIPFFRGFVGLELGFKPFVGLGPFRGVTAGLDQRVGIAALAVVAFAQGFENVHWLSSWPRFELTLLRLDICVQAAVPPGGWNAGRFSG